jgi:hypothetical protein
MGVGLCSSNKQQTDESNIIGIKPIIIETETWKRDSHGLFDYETHDVIRKTLKASGNSKIYRENDTLEIAKTHFTHTRRTNRMFDESHQSKNNTANDLIDIEESK